MYYGIGDKYLILLLKYFNIDTILCVDVIFVMSLYNQKSLINILFFMLFCFLKILDNPLPNFLNENGIHKTCLIFE